MNNNNISPRVQSFSLTDKGRRGNNEDFVTSFEPTDPRTIKSSGYMYIVADGVGGASIGERASKHAAEMVKSEYVNHPEVDPAIRLKQAILKANREIFDYAEENGIRMATTITVAVIIDNKLITANVGDSRIYLIRGSEVTQLTNDHNIVGELVRMGDMTEADALTSKAKNKLTRSIGGHDEVHVDVFDPIYLQPGDKILLCSDGLTRYALKEDIARMAANGSPEQITNRAMDFAKKRGHGGADNISVITVAYEPTGQLETVGVQQERPLGPEEQWEIMETDPGFSKRRGARSGRGVWLFAIVGVSLIIILTISGYYLMTGNNTTIAPESTQSNPSTTEFDNTQSEPSTSPMLQPATEALVEGTSTPENGNLANTETTALIGIVKEDCPQFLNVRSFPSRDENIAQEIGKLDCGESISLLGKYNDGKDNWLLIDYLEFQQAWVIAVTVDVSKDTFDRLPNISPPPIPTASPIFTPTIEPVEIVYCEYVVQSGDYLSQIARNFGLDGNYSGITCAPDSPGTCTLINPDDITAGWVLIIPNVYLNVCIQNKGQPQ